MNRFARKLGQNSKDNVKQHTVQRLGVVALISNSFDEIFLLSIGFHIRSGVGHNVKMSLSELAQITLNAEIILSYQSKNVGCTSYLLSSSCQSSPQVLQVHLPSVINIKQERLPYLAHCVHTSFPGSRDGT